MDREDNVFWLGIAVIDKLRGKGIGSTIMEYLLDYAKKIEVQELKLAVDKNNEKAIKMYNTYGFKALKELDKSIIMIKNG